MLRKKSRLGRFKKKLKCLLRAKDLKRCRRLNQDMRMLRRGIKAPRRSRERLVLFLS
jgi:hypothetical protein